MLKLHAGTVGLSAETLADASLVALEVAFAESVRLPPGAALDDYLVDARRSGVDDDAVTALQRWRTARGADLVIDGLDLGHVWEVELLARCFLPLARLRSALPSAAEHRGAEHVVGMSLEPELMGVVAAVAEESGLGAATSDEPGGTLGPTPRAHLPLPVRLLARTGMPPRIRGEILCVPYWHLAGIYSRLASRPASRPVAYGLTLPAASVGHRVRMLVAGGWLGGPSQVARGRATARTHAALDELAAGGGSVDAAVDRLALSVLRRFAADTLALRDRARRAFEGGSVRKVVVPFDSPETMRVLLACSREAGVRSLVVQHGFDAGLNDPDKSVADEVAVWSEAERGELARRGITSVTVVGNPGAEHLADPPVPAPARGRRAIVLVEYPSRLSTRVRARAGGEHVRAALRALARARPGTTAVIRPHPSDPDPTSYLRAASDTDDLHVELDGSTPIEPLLRSADLCVGALSTATLQAAALGVPTALLDLTDATRPWPFDGGDGLPRATSADMLAELVGGPLDAAREPALAALGARRGATGALVDLIAAD